MAGCYIRGWVIVIFSSGNGALFEDRVATLFGGSGGGPGRRFGGNMGIISEDQSFWKGGIHPWNH
jgi:hypothetical protein